MKKINLVFTLAVCFSLISCMDVFAYDNNTFINSNNVELTQKEFEFVNEFYGNEFFNKMTKADYDWLYELDINNRNVEVKSFISYESEFGKENNGVKRAPTYTSGNKRLSIAKSCSTNCTIITNLTWLGNPAIKSYDLIGAYLSNTSLANENIITSINSSSGTSYSSSNKIFANGLGTSVKLPDSTNIIVQQKFYVRNSGHVYASYQHATSNISLQTSLNYNISNVGYGGVFLFYGDAIGKYDGMAGVDI